MTSYIYNEVEVTFTGRTAQRKSGRATSKNPEVSTEIIFEIEPIDKLVNWQKWVSRSELFEVTKLDWDKIAETYNITTNRE